MAKRAAEDESSAAKRKKTKHKSPAEVEDEDEVDAAAAESDSGGSSSDSSSSDSSGSDSSGSGSDSGSSSGSGSSSSDDDDDDDLDEIGRAMAGAGNKSRHVSSTSSKTKSVGRTAAEKAAVPEGYLPVTASCPVNLDDLRSGSKELWLVRLPSHLDVAELSGAVVNLDKAEPTIKIGSNKYQCTMASAQGEHASRLQQTVAIVPRRKDPELRIGPSIARELVVARKLAVPKLDHSCRDDTPDHGVVKQPSGLKYNGSIFGSASPVFSSASLKKKKSTALPNTPKSDKKKKKKKDGEADRDLAKKKKKSLGSSAAASPAATADADSKKKKKRKSEDKRKRSMDTGV